MQQEFVRFIKDYLRSFYWVMESHYLGRDVMRSEDYDVFFDFCQKKTAEIFAVETLEIDLSEQATKWVSSFFKVFFYDNPNRGNKDILDAIDTIDVMGKNEDAAQFVKIYSHFSDSVSINPL